MSQNHSSSLFRHILALATSLTTILAACSSGSTNTPSDVIGSDSGPDDANVDADVDANTTLRQLTISAGEFHTCGLTKTGAVKCWGYNDYGQIGDGSTGHKYVPTSVVGLSSGVVAISAGRYHTCALTDTGKALCWGENRDGQLGIGQDANWFVKHSVPTPVPGLESGVVAISAGEWHTCAVTAAGAAKCWGYNEYGQLGNGEAGQQEIEYFPVQVKGLESGVVAIGAGSTKSCALMQSNELKCWGRNNYGALGDGTTEDRYTPVTVVGLEAGIKTFTVGFHVCVITKAGAAMCWGVNGSGAVGDGTTEDRLTPTQVVGFETNTVAITSGDGYVCAINSGGSVKCWGENEYGTIGDGTTIWDDKTRKTVPTQVSGLTSGATYVAAGGDHACAIIEDDTAMCWGGNEWGGLGDGTNTNHLVPVQVVGFP